MEQASIDTLRKIATRDTWTIEEHRELQQQLFHLTDAPRKFSEVLEELEDANPEPQGAVALKIGIARYMLCRFDQAIAALTAATAGKEREYFLAQCYRGMRNWDKAISQFQAAKKQGWDAIETDVRVIEAKAQVGDMDGAAQDLQTLEKAVGTSDDPHTQADLGYLKGLLAELNNLSDEALDAYEAARELCPEHSEVTFRLAYHLDLHGDEEDAMALYQECLQAPPVYVNALLNLAVLLEDAEEYPRAVACCRRILRCNPNHTRARLFLHDALASTDMFYDEDQARRIAKRNAVLDIPVTDFELSVRARNCLKKMNIHTLGDLVNTSEPELLGYKNFGETSLKEIKDMLSIKGLRLGQAADEVDEFGALMGASGGEMSPEEEGSRAIRVDQIELSVRAKRVLEEIGVATLGELADHTEVELMGRKNFGQTSLAELRELLVEHGLTFRGEGLVADDFDDDDEEVDLDFEVEADSEA